MFTATLIAMTFSGPIQYKDEYGPCATEEACIHRIDTSVVYLTKLLKNKGVISISGKCEQDDSKAV